MRTLLTGVAAAACALALAVPAQARPAAPAPSPHATYLNGLNLHLRNGTTLRVPLRGRGAAYTTLLGRSPQGWVLESGAHVYLFSRGTVTRIGGTPQDLYATTTLSADGSTYWSVDTGQGSGGAVYARGIDGRSAGNFYVDTGYLGQLSADGDHAWVGGSDLVELTRKQPGGRAPDPVVVDKRNVSLIDARQGVVFVHDTGLGDGPTSLAAPGTPAWHLKGLVPIAVSRRGSYLVAQGSGSGLAVYRMSDGSLVRNLDVKYDYDAAAELAWAGDSTLLFDVAARGGQALESCYVVSGTCRLVRSASRYGYSLADSLHMLT